MAGRAKKTEHAGPKKGSGAYWGRKVDAKRESNRARREGAKRAVRQGLTDSGSETGSDPLKSDALFSSSIEKSASSKMP